MNHRKNTQRLTSNYLVDMIHGFKYLVLYDIILLFDLSFINKKMSVELLQFVPENE